MTVAVRVVISSSATLFALLVQPVAVTRSPTRKPSASQLPLLRVYVSPDAAAAIAGDPVTTISVDGPSFVRFVDVVSTVSVSTVIGNVVLLDKLPETVTRS